MFGTCIMSVNAVSSLNCIQSRSD